MKYEDLIDKAKALQEKIEDIETGDELIVLNVIPLEDMDYEIIKIYTFNTKNKIIGSAQYKYSCEGYYYEVFTYKSILNIGGSEDEE